MIASILGWARTARSLPARLLHPLRRWQTRRRLGGRPPPRSIVFVCHGNICRSPYAAAAFSREVPPMFRAGVRIDSAGFVGPGRPAPLNAVQVAARRGLDLAAHRSSLVGLGGRIGSDLVVVMEPTQARAVQGLFGRDGHDIVVLGDLDPEPIATRAIADPVEQPQAAFEASYTRIDRCVAELGWVLFPGMAAR